MDKLINELLARLQPVLKSQRKAEQLLRRYWADKVALIWTVRHVHQAANENNTVLTEQEARQLLVKLHTNHNKQYGLKWEDVVEAIKESGYGRDIKRPEVHNLIHRNILTIDPPKKGRP